MTCRQCNTEVGNQRFCPNCGTEVSMVQAGSQPQVQHQSYNEPVAQCAQVDAPMYGTQDNFVNVPPVNQTNYGQPYGMPQSNQYGAPQGGYDPYAQQSQYQQYLPNNNQPQYGYQNPNQSQYGYQNNATPATEDPGKGKATGALVCGILALFFGWIPAVIALIMANQYAKVGNGSSANTVKAGKIMAWIGIAGSILSVLICIFIFIGVLGALGSAAAFI